MVEEKLLGNSGIMQLRVLILGVYGMLGHKLFHSLGTRFNIFGTFRGRQRQHSLDSVFGSWKRDRLIGNVDAFHFDTVAGVINEIQPHVVINCIGIVKQRVQAGIAIPCIQVNALFPHQLADLCKAIGSRLIHFSTDCVFSGTIGSYSEDDLTDPVDLYGRTKLLGEVDSSGCLTLRTSVVGWELNHRVGLLEWFAAQRGKAIRGYRGAIYTGISTGTMAQLIGEIVATWTDLNGVYHVASEPISKYDLLAKLQAALGWRDIKIDPDEEFHCDRSLVGTCFQEATGWLAPSWREMIAGLAAEWPEYEKWRKSS